MKFVTISLTLTMSLAYGAPAPVNDLNISKLNSTLNTLFDREFRSVGRKLEIVVDRSYPQTAAEAAREGLNKAKVTVYGGFTTNKFINMDGFAAVVCHEMGHHIGGAPKKSGDDKWSSAEGQADYWAANKCLRRLFRKENNTAALSGVEIPKEVLEACTQAYSSDEDRILCQRIAMAGNNFITVLKSIKNMHQTIDFTTFPRERTFTTDHPGIKCRLQTFFSGALCTSDESQEVSQKDPNKGFCRQERTTIQPGRPACWYGEE